MPNLVFLDLTVSDYLTGQKLTKCSALLIRYSQYPFIQHVPSKVTKLERDSRTESLATCLKPLNEKVTTAVQWLANS